MIIAQLNVSLIVTALVGVGLSQVCPQHGEHISVQTRPALRVLQFSLQATLQPQLIIYSTLYASVAVLPASHSTTTTDKLQYPVCCCSMDSCNKDNERSVISQHYCSAKADDKIDIVEASSELDGIIVILGGFRWIHNLKMSGTIEHICSLDMLMPEHYAHIFSQQHP